MKTNHSYYYQVQHSMLVTNLNCDFYLWSIGKADNDTFLVRTENDTAHCETIMVKHIEVFEKMILLELNT